MKRTRLWRWAAVIIMGIFLLTVPACGKKGDPIPPRTAQPAGAGTQQPAKPATGTGTQKQPDQPKTGTGAEQPQQPKTGTGTEQQEKPPGMTPAK